MYNVWQMWSYVKKLVPDQGSSHHQRKMCQDNLLRTGFPPTFDSENKASLHSVVVAVVVVAVVHAAAVDAAVGLAQSGDSGNFAKEKLEPCGKKRWMKALD